MKLFQTTDDGKQEWDFWVKLGDTVWYCDASFAEKDIPKTAGFSFHGKKGADGRWEGKRVWWTSDRDKASKLAEYSVDPQGWGKELSQRKVQLATSLTESRQSVSFKDYPKPEGQEYMPFQKVGIGYMMVRQNTLLADEPGIGKTIQAIGVINTDPSIKTVLVICPATIKLNWKREMEKWFVRDMGRIVIADTKTCPLPENGFNVVITHYEAVGKINKKLSSLEWDLLIVDEAHLLKNMKTVRYQSIMGEAEGKYDRIAAKRKIFATGTPIVNRPSELWPLISAVDPEHWNQKTFWYYHKRYCNVQNTGYGMDFKGAGSDEKLNELQLRLRESIMIRRLKSEVLTELPPKIRQVIELEYDEDDAAVKKALRCESVLDRDGDGNIQAAAEVELAKASDNDDDYKKAIERITLDRKWAFEEMARVRHDTAVAKIPYALEFIKEQLESVGKAVIFAHHRDVIEAFAKEFPLDSVSIYGGMELEDRQASVDRFQDDPSCRLALVSIMAGGVGITLTAASHEYFIELDWVPGNVTQAEDRCHRIGQKDVVNVYHLVLRDSIDVKLARTIISKQKIIEQALDKITEKEPMILTKDESATKGMSRKKIAEEAEKITDDQVVQVHICLKHLSGKDTDYARAINGVGFNKIDGAIGHSLAESLRLTKKQAVLGRKLLKKYRCQLEGVVSQSLFE